ncbi:hypothetical protein Anas_02457 [Armadillidium nasatum]|uniref:Uncharacterized protein n=1 Tax=Armadillidium nasatum TaxID=96803 RepID=A0A5N5TJQ6_9CRUS|nr:hypothetical protein Anas_02457 [Armadillidium nasatum]
MPQGEQVTEKKLNSAVLNMSSGKDWTHQWILSSMGPSGSDATADNEDAQNISSTSGAEYNLEDSLINDPLDERVSTSPVTSLDLDRDSPMACGIDDDDAGPPSIETQPPDNSDLEVAGITSTWINCDKNIKICEV